MKTPSKHTARNALSGWMGRRTASIALGIFLGVALGLHSARHPANSALPNAAEPAKPVRLAAHPKAHSSSPPHAWHQIGLASWYGNQFQGKETADGEAYNMHDLTCAHRFLPLGTWLKVTDLHTHKWIVVRVNDRGPVPDTRIADLSSEAARMLGMRNRGVTRVRLDVIDPQQAVEVARLDRLRLARLAAQAEEPPSGD